MEHIISELTDDLHEKIKVAQRHGYGPMITSLPISEGDSVSIESFRTNQQAYTIFESMEPCALQTISQLDFFEVV